MLREKYVKMYEEFIMQLCIYMKVIGILAKWYLPISLITPLRLQNILDEVKTALHNTNPDYDIIIKRLHLSYDMRLVTFGTGKDKNLTIPSFHLAIHTTVAYTVSIRNSTSSNHRPEYTGRLLQTFTNRQTIHSSKL